MKKIEFEKLTDLALEYGLTPDLFFFYWEEYGSWQIDYLLAQGLKPNHKLLDVGCGPLRFGVKAIEYLEDGNYYGIDAFSSYVSLGKDIANEMQLNKNYGIKYSENFDFGEVENYFDFAIAQSVFTHLSKKQVQLCVEKLGKVMRKGGLFVFTFFGHDRPRGFFYYGGKPFITSAFLDNSFYQELGDSNGFEVSFQDGEHMKNFNLNSQSICIYKKR